MKTLFVSALVFLVALAIFGIPWPELNGSIVEGIAAAVVVKIVIGFAIGVTMLIMTTLGGAIAGGALSNKKGSAELGAGCGLFFGIGLSFLADVLVYVYLNRLLPWFPTFTWWQAILTVGARLVLGIYMGDYRTKNSDENKKN